ncbi:AGE family epimerase/isomerase [Parafilimonas terrae]|uniref:Cellobiose 2-epimerase n=1 Tax=Parafilimonas terrae TaxID=1465490 RepID=A0A1I5XXM3_9BACT|nr:AGE family epimerase/isomerase [Parafilimonas terrae]SFQ36676.1 mannobiose 2-epimerase [Parafilimonas terrae]
MQPEQLKQQLYNELLSILDYWMKHTVDEINGGFFGKIDNANDVYATAPKGAVLNARILWTFSAAYNAINNEKYLSIATRAFEYLREHFIDKEYGGVCWTVDFEGKALDSKKQVYALAFCIYGLSEYHLVTKNNEALNLALDLYKTIEEHSYDKQYKGYFEAFAKDWLEMDDLRLSAKDANEKKTMNTHLHIIEAYANLYKVYPFEDLKNKIAELLELFDTYFIDHKTWHLRLFFDEQWNEKPNVISYGHDIEAAWLLLQCAEIINDKKWIKIYKQYAVKITDATAEGLDKDGGLWYEYEPLQKALIKEKHWWPQAEALVGFYNAYELTGDDKYLQQAVNTWQFIQQHILDSSHGEWFWGVKEDNSVMQKEDKAGLWKCPYHNSRACLEIIKRV